ncbi:MAG: BMC domain-containing protein [Oscillospiraceae bacterium]|jgi:microcompartment protein CcmL/EutN|nr:BMC domain-containing protein [Oscillospiraceae bacterium]
MNAIAFLELSSIAKGMEAADAIIKTAETELLFARASCPGKYYILFSGEVAAVSASLDAGAAWAEGFLVDSCLIPRVHPQVAAAIHQTAEPAAYGAVGVMEFYSVTAAIYAADAAVKAAAVDLIELRLATGIGGKSFAVVVGEVAAVRAAVDAGIASREADGFVLAHCVIPSPVPELFEMIG